MVAGVLEILIKTKDEVSSGLSKAESAVKKSGDKISAWTIAKGQMIGRYMEKAVSTTADFAKQTVKSAIKSFAEFEQLEGGIKKVFGDDWKTVSNNASRAFMTAGLSANEYMSSVMEFSSALKQSCTDTAEAATIADQAIVDMSDNANMFGSSMESIQNAYRGFSKQNYTMLDNLKLGYGGTKTEMERLLKDATELTGKKYDIKNLKDVYEAIHAIQVEQKVAGTTKDEAMRTIEGSMKATKAAWQNVLASIGKGKDIKNAIKQFSETAKVALKNLRPVFKNAVSGIFTAVKEILPEVGGMIDDLITGMKQSDSPVLQALAKSIEFAKNAIEGLSALINDFPGTVEKLKVSDDPFAKLIGGGLDALYNALKWINENVGVQGAIEGIVGAFLALEGLKVSSSVLGFIEKLGSLKFLLGSGASDFAAAGTTAGMSWGKSFGAAIMKAVPWLAGLITLLNPDGSGMNGSRDEGGQQGDIYDEEGIITQGGKDAGVTQADVDKEIEAAKEYRDAHQQMLESTGLTDKQIKAIKDFNAQLSLHKQGSSSFDNENYTKAWENLQKAFEGQDEALSAYMDKLKSLTPQDVLDDSFFNIDKNGAQIPFTPDMSAVESAEVPTLHGTVEYSAEFSGGGGVIETPFGKTYHRRKPKAKGDWYVPYDDYPALLHRGEMVLTKSQARQYRDGEGGGFDVNSAINNAVASAMSKVYVMMNGDKVGDLTTKRVKKNINASSYNKLRAMGG